MRLFRRLPKPQECTDSMGTRVCCIHDRRSVIQLLFVFQKWFCFGVGTPGRERPYGWCVMNYNIVESNMKMRRNQLVKALEGTGCVPLCITGFPRSVATIQVC